MKLAIDIGGTWLRYETVGEEELCGKLPSREHDLLDFIGSMIRKHPQIDAVAVSFAGQVHDGTILSAPNITVSTPEIRDTVESRFGVRLLIENDLNSAALAESLYWEAPFLCALYSGSGLGAGIVEGGELLHGFRSLAGEIGHVPYRRAPFRCGCGKSNCLELYASGSGLAKWMEYEHCAEPVDLEALRQSSDPACRRIADDYLEALLHAAATLLTLCNPSHLILGGGVIRANDWVVDELRCRIGDYALAASLAGVRIELTRLEEASLEGAKLLLDKM
ncbi:ROK family protein [Nitratifractor sp.]